MPSPLEEEKLSGRERSGDVTAWPNASTVHLRYRYISRAMKNPMVLFLDKQVVSLLSVRSAKMTQFEVLLRRWRGGALQRG